MKIRFAEDTDLNGVLKYDRHIPEERVAACIRHGQVFVLCEGDAVAGVLRHSLFWQSVPFLDLLFIDEACRGKGWGRKVMAHWEDAMAGAGYPYVMLSTQADETAQFFYEKLGYHRIGAFLPPEQEAEEIVYLKELTK